ncbi:MAG: hypothetical protein V8T10_02740 [Merdibacter sp.]
MAREFLDACGVKRYECEGIEADDIIGSFASAHPEVSITILSSDRDLLQLIDKTTDVLLMKKGISEMQLMDLQALEGRVWPSSRADRRPQGADGRYGRQYPGGEGRRGKDGAQAAQLL